MKFKNKEIIAQLGLLIVTIIWGSAFVVVKNTTDNVAPNWIIAIRFWFAAVLILLFFHKRFHSLGRGYLKAGLIAGALFYAAYYLQTEGVQYTSAGKNAFLTAGYVVLVPFIYWIFKSKKPGVQNIAAAFLCIAGIGLISLKDDFSVNPGDLLSLLGGIAFAAQIVATGIYVKKLDPIVFAFSEFSFAALFGTVAALLTEQPPQGLPANTLFSLVYIGVMSTFVALLLQTVCQKYVPPAKASLIMSLEAVFGCLFGALFLREELSLKTGIGFVLIFGAILISEAKPGLFSRKNVEPVPVPLNQPDKSRR